MQGKKSYFICWHEHDQIALLSKLTKYGQSKRSWPPSNRQNGITLTLKNVLWIFLFNCTSWTSVRCPIFHQLTNNVFAFYWTREFGYVSLNVLYNLSINILFKTHNDVYLRRDQICRVILEIKRHRFSMQWYGEIYIECKHTTFLKF